MEGIESFIKRHWLKRFGDYSSYALAAMLAGLILFIVIGQYFIGLLDFFGAGALYSDQAGVYVDCSKPKNRDASFCQPKEQYYDKTWRDLKGKSKPLPFKLSD